MSRAADVVIVRCPQSAQHLKMYPRPTTGRKAEMIAALIIGAGTYRTGSTHFLITK